ncbi:hypothetical protein ACHHYP_04913 [Achlya hypogyna]|uniref:Cyclic nucleotide-binding domain-containing protein n=1 Tax=Achlya hypogyna TaxID=1202772 RepID=A0A1V9YZR9_ACHHY|nr:hypothetical protein ACHHYP_04913 [Achlya hypogyna]
MGGGLSSIGPRHGRQSPKPDGHQAMLTGRRHGQRRKDAVWNASILASLFCMRSHAQLSSQSIEMVLPATGSVVPGGLELVLVFDGTFVAEVVGLGQVQFRVHAHVKRDNETAQIEHSRSLIQFLNQIKTGELYVAEEAMISRPHRSKLPPGLRDGCASRHAGIDDVYIIRFLIPRGQKSDVVAKSIYATKIEVQGKVRAMGVPIDLGMESSFTASIRSFKWRPSNVAPFVRSMGRSMGRSARDDRVAISEDCARIMRASPFFADIPSRDLADLADIGTISIVEPGVQLMKENESGGKELTILLAGTVAVQKADKATNALKAVTLLKSGACIGEMSFLIHMPRTATLVTETESMLMSLDGDAFLKFLQSFPQVHKKLVGMLCERFVQNAVAQGTVPFFNAIPYETLMEWARLCFIEEAVPPKTTVLPVVGRAKFSLLLSGSVEHPRPGSQKTRIATSGYFGTFGQLQLALPGPWGDEATTVTPCVFLSCWQDVCNKLFDAASLAAIHIRWFQHKCDALAVIDHPLACSAFLRFTSAEFSQENILFIQAVQRYRLCPTRDFAAQLCREYVAATAPQQVNIDAKMRQEILDTLATLPEHLYEEIPRDTLSTLFERAFDEILRLVRKDSFPRFKKTPYFADMLANFDLYRHDSVAKTMALAATYKPTNEHDTIHRRFNNIINQVHDGDRKRRKHKSIAQRSSILVRFSLQLHS